MKKGIFLIIAISLWFIPLYGQGVYVTISSEMDSIICENQLSEIDSCLLRLKITYDKKISTPLYIRPVISIDANATVSGNGTVDDPYILK